MRISLQKDYIMINKRFDIIEKSDINTLISNQVTEGKTLDYKERHPNNSDSDKKEFLVDISSFTNASGGDILYGIKEKRDDHGNPTGIPEIACGLEGINADAEIRRLDNIVRDGIAPRISGVHIKAIEGFSNGPVILLRIPKSWTSPHMVTFQNSSRFYSRNSAGKYQLDVSEIRSAFALSETLPEKIRRFRDNRITKIIADETPVPLDPCPKIVLHILPIAALDPVTSLDISILDDMKGKLVPIYADGWSSRYNFDGFLTYRSFRGQPTCPSYLQIFRHGAIEAVEASILSEEWSGKKVIPSLVYERELISAVDRYLKLEQDFGFGPPIFILLSLLGVKDYTMAVDRSRFLFIDPKLIDRDVLLLPDIIVEDYESKASDILRPVFDAVWQAAGWDCSKNYDKDGKWVGR